MTRLTFLLSSLMMIGYCSCAPESTTIAPSPAPSAFEDPPAWASEVIWYQIFVERFRNGDPTNDPTIRDIEGSYPGFTPSTWKVSPWTKDWYEDDTYIADLGNGTDWFGTPITTFGQKSQMRRYGGDLQGVFDKLDYIEALGVTAIYFNPLNDAPSLHKYDPRHWRHVDRNFGPDPDQDIATMAKEVPDDPATWQFTTADQMFLELIRTLHKRGIKVILDYSWNHTGHRFWAWEDLVENQAKSKYADWYWVLQFDDPATPENEFDYRGWFGVVDLPEIKETEYHDHADAVKPFDGDLASEAAKQHIFAVTKRWLDPNGDGDPSDGVDGFRLDVAAELPLGFWREYREVVREINPEAYLLGEVWWEQWPDKLLDPQVYLEGDIFDAVMNYRWYRAARHFFNASPDPILVSTFVDSLNRFRSNLRSQNNFAMMNLNGSHDAPRVLTSLFNKNAYKYNAKPEQDSSYKIHKPDPATFETLRLLLAQQYTYIGAPHIWAGDEMGMWGADDPNPRKPLIWPDLQFEAERAHPLGLPRPIDQVAFDAELFDYYKKLIQVRKDHPVLIHGDIDFVVVDDASQTLAYRRFNEEGQQVLAIFNANTTPQTITVPGNFTGKYQDLLGNAIVESDTDQLQVQLPGRRAAIISDQ